MKVLLHQFVRLLASKYLYMRCRPVCRKGERRRGGQEGDEKGVGEEGRGTGGEGDGRGGGEEERGTGGEGDRRGGEGDGMVGEGDGRGGEEEERGTGGEGDRRGRGRERRGTGEEVEIA